MFEASVMPALLYNIPYLCHVFPSRPKNKKETLKHVIPSHAVPQSNYSIMPIF